VAVAAAKAGRVINAQSVEINNTGAASVTVDFKDGSGGTIMESFVVPPGGISHEECEEGKIGGWLTTAGNGLFAATRAAATGVEIVVEYGRL
jgi:hypothetical protein